MCVYRAAVCNVIIILEILYDRISFVYHASAVCNVIEIVFDSISFVHPRHVHLY